MRRKILFAISTLIVMCPVFASAITLADLEMKLRFVADQLKDLQSQAGAVALSVGSQASSPECPNLTRPLAAGDSDTNTGGEVTSLQNFLIVKGEISTNAFEKFSKGYFGNLTKTALESWQTSNGLMATGHLDDVTRSKIASACTRDESPLPQITLSADRSAVSAGEAAIVTWSTRNATRCTMTTSSDGATLEERVELTGTKEMHPVVSLDVKVSCANEVGVQTNGPQSSKSISIAVQNQTSASVSTDVRAQLASTLSALEAMLKQIISR